MDRDQRARSFRVVPNLPLRCSHKDKVYNQKVRTQGWPRDREGLEKEPHVVHVGTTWLQAGEL